ncbi:hypothetical protein TRFO_22750 [Tritrichomonas foetus]|uniref:Intimal thickness related receptor IRP domain-containing protein n=1 Tax=Tritrichomonas foetus TaxID=1144522 RepID=A0A1J4KCK0_9EUKA|nr:hypothetical protein TRFO_22750 [Tritrichomonas foetus]|eukprot:OHT08664.1 hypothetical protein TRFO_22750 [Tritrichomonas foetus]
MIFSLFFIILYKKKVSVYTSRSQFLLPDFGFDENGTYSIDVDIPPDFQQHLQLSFLDSEGYRKISVSFFPPLVCDMDYPKYDINFTNHIFNGTIENKTTLYPFLLRCEENIFSYIDITATVTYKNPTTYLDNRLVTGISSQMAMSIIFFTFSIIWIVNWILNFKYQIGLHYCLTATILSVMFYHAIRFCELKQLDKSDDSKGFTGARITFKWISASIFAFFLLLAAHGFCVVVDTISRKKVLLSAFYSAFFIGCMSFLLYYNYGSNRNILMIFTLISAVLYGHELIVNLSHASYQLVALLLAASNSGLPTGTPIFLKNDLYLHFQRILLAILLLVMTYLAINSFSYAIPLWAIEFIGQSMELGILLSLAYLFRLRKSSHSDYHHIDDGIEGDDIPLRTLDNPADYISGGPSPTQPLLIQTPSGEQTATGKFVSSV